MAELTVTIPNDKVEDLAAAIEAGFGRNEGESDSEMAKRYIINRLRRVYIWHKGNVSKIAAEQNAQDDIPLT